MSKKFNVQYPMMDQMQTWCERDHEWSAHVLVAADQFHIGMEHDRLCKSQPEPAHCSWNLKHKTLWSLINKYKQQAQHVKNANFATDVNKFMSLL